MSLLAAAVDPACGGTVSGDSSDPDRYGGDSAGPGGRTGAEPGTAGSAGAAAVDAAAVGIGGAVDAAGPDAVPPDAGLDAVADVVWDAPADVVVDAPVDAIVDAEPDSDVDAEPPVILGFWEELPVTGPSPRWGHGVSYDGARDRVVLFGGWPGPSTAIESETWEWDGVQWELVAPAGAGPRTWIFFGMTYDSVRELTLVHGGYTNTVSDACGSRSESSATWGWDGTEWVLLSCEGPAARGLELAYDSARGRVVTLAGGTPSSETWEWDGESWEMVGTGGPSARTNYALAFDSARARVVLFGGNGGLLYGDTWEWDGTTWELMAETGPPAAEEATMAYFGGELQRTVLYVEGETWQWDGRDWTHVDAISPSPRENAAMTYDEGRGHIVFFGGDVVPTPDHQNLGDTWIYGVRRSLQ